MEDWVPIGYLISAIFFIFGLKKLGHPRTAPKGNQFGMLGMATAVVTTIVDMNFLPDGIVGWTLIIAGILIGSLIGYIMAV
ncbi:MAG: NAD(P)(+) transhydrogenase (Re/Si-specific) subunit beta, partial [Candidatus Poseidoniaceae archaeon]